MKLGNLLPPGLRARGRYSRRCMEIADFAESHPGKHNQYYFFTDVYRGHQVRDFQLENLPEAICLAGMAVIRYGRPSLKIVPRGGLTTPSGKITIITTVARKALGLTWHQAYPIFHCYNKSASIAMLRAVAANPSISREELETLAIAPEYV